MDGMRKKYPVRPSDQAPDRVIRRVMFARFAPLRQTGRAFARLDACAALLPGLLRLIGP